MVKGYEWIMRLYQILLLLLLIFAFAPNVLSAPDPIEVKERQAGAPIAITGNIIKDNLLEDVEEKRGQNRKMSVEIEQIFQNTLAIPLYKKQWIEVHYYYLPSWSNDVGGGSIQVKEGDRIKLWLDKDEEGFTPILGSYGVEILQMNGARIEHVPEPFLHLMKRHLHRLWSRYSHYMVLILLLFTLFLILAAGLQRQKTQGI